MLNILTKLVFGPRANGVPVPQPKLKTTNPANRLEENEWTKEFNVSSRYGHRGSFYQENFRYTVA